MNSEDGGNRKWQRGWAFLERKRSSIDFYSTPNPFVPIDFIFCSQCCGMHRTTLPVTDQQRRATRCAQGPTWAERLCLLYSCTSPYLTVAFISSISICCGRPSTHSHGLAVGISSPLPYRLSLYYQVFVRKWLSGSPRANQSYPSTMRHPIKGSSVA